MDEFQIIDKKKALNQEGFFVGSNMIFSVFKTMSK